MLLSLKSMWRLWNEFLSSRQNATLLNFWWLVYCSVLIEFSIFRSETNDEQHSKGTIVAPTTLWSIWSPYFMLKFKLTLLSKTCSESVLKTARPDATLELWPSLFCSSGLDLLSLIKKNRCHCVSLERACSWSSTLSVVKGQHRFLNSKVLCIEDFGSQNVNSPQ